MTLVGLDDGFFPHPKQGGRTVLAAVFLDSNLRPRKARLSWVRVDGHDATDTALKMLEGEGLGKGDFILLDGVTYAGFNYIDPHRLSSGLGGRVGVIVFFRWLPDPVRVWRALKKNFHDAELRWNVIGRVIRGAQPLVLRGLGVHVYSPNLSREEIAGILSECTLWGAQPEPLRLAHMVASGVSRLPSLQRL